MDENVNFVSKRLNPPKRPPDTSGWEFMKLFRTKSLRGSIGG